MKTQHKKLTATIAVPLLTGAVSAYLNRTAILNFGSVNQPPLSPPSWLFPVVWTILYVLMGIASYLTVISEKNSGKAITVYALQLFFNFLWTFVFFGLRLYFTAFVLLAVLWVLITVTLVTFYKIRKAAGILLLPYLLWVTFAGYLNFAVFLLN